MSDSPLMTVAELAAAFGLSRRQVYRAVHTYDVPYRIAGRSWLIDPDAFSLFVMWGHAPKEKSSYGIR